MDTPEQARIAAENRARGQAEWAAEVRERHAHQRRVADAAWNPSDVERLAEDARRDVVTATNNASRVDPADLEARLIAAEAVAKAARTAFDIIDIRAQAAVVRALGDAGSDPVARAKAAARAQADWAEAVGRAEADYQAASFEVDRAAIEDARARVIATHRTKSAEARLAAAREKEGDPLRLSNPFADPIRPVITQSQFDSIRDPALKARAALEADIVPDDDPPYTRENAEALLRSRGSNDRVVLTRAEFDSLSPADQAKAAREAIILDG